MKRISAYFFIFLLSLLSPFWGNGGGGCFAQWSDVGGGLNNVGTVVYSLGIYNNKLIAGGWLLAPGAVNSGGIASWNGFKWDSLQRGTAGGKANSFYQYNGEMYVGGDFGSVKDTIIVPNSAYLAKWNGTNWSSVSAANPNDRVKAIQYKNELVVGGNFTQIGSTTYNLIAKWNGTSWSGVGGGIKVGGFTNVDAMTIYKGDLIATGYFFNVGSTWLPASCIARWDGVKWDSLSGGLDEEAFAVTVDTANNFLYAGGNFYGVFNRGEYTSTNYVARWDGFRWSELGINKDNLFFVRGGVLALEMYHHELFVGDVSPTGTQADTNLARWDGNNWYKVPGPNCTVDALKTWNDSLYVGGCFDSCGTQKVNYIAKYYTPPDTTCKFLQPLMYAYPPGNPKLYADTFKYAGDSVAIEFYNNIGSASSWQWNFGDSTTSSGKTPVHYYTAGTYTVSVIVTYPYGPKGPCIDTVYRTITVINTTGIKELKVSGLKFKVFPNPAKNEITIEMTSPPAPLQRRGEYVVRIKNSAGQNIFEQQFEKELKINTADFKKGIYLVEVCILTPGPSPGGEGGKCHSEKVIIQ